MPPYDEAPAAWSRPAASGGADASEPETAGFFTQFAASMKKNMLQKKNRACSCVMETLLPAIFVLGLIGIWAATNPVDNDGRNFANYTLMQQLLPAQRVAETLPTLACINTTLSGGATVGDLLTCEDFIAAHANGSMNAHRMHTLQRPPTGADMFYTTPQCFPENGLPDIRGLCVMAAPAMMISPYGFSFDSPREIPSLDDAILAKQLALLAFPERPERGSSESSLGSVRREGKIHFSPDTPAVRALIGYLNSTSTYFHHVMGTVFESYDAMDAFAKDVERSEGKMWLGLQVDEMDAGTLSIRIRVNRTVVLTSLVYQVLYSGGTDDRPTWYLSSGVMSLHKAVNDYYLTQIKGLPLPPQPVVTRMGFIPWTQQVFLQIAGGLAPLMLVLSFLYPVSQLVKGIVLEKENRIREAMMIMGLGSGSFYASWFITYALQFLITSIVSTILLCISFIPQANPLIVFFTFYFFCLSSIALAMMLASLFSKARLASLLSPVIYFILSMPLFAVDNLPAGGKAVLMLLSPSAFAGGLQLIFNYEQGTGLGNKELAAGADDIPMIVVLFFLAFDTIIYLLLTLYFDAIVPSEWGTKRHPLFCCVDPIRWCMRRSGSKGAADGEEMDGRDPNGVFEDDSGATNPISVRIRGLRKQFTRGDRTFMAVDRLSLNLRENEVNVLLGHNGAGKSTTINMMTGMIDIDGGDCEVYGHSVRNEKSTVHRMIGFCPQHNVLWPELSCYNHLNFFATIKGVPSDERDAEIRRMLKAVDLLEKIDYAAGSLSGGQKRKLSVAIAFIGGSKLVFLDEPTAGCDVHARRFLWDLIKAMAPGRTILLTTHYLDEADLLGSTISIMSKGRLRCSGSSMFLKSRMGVGYSLNMSVDPARDTQPTADAVRSKVFEAAQLPCGAGELAFRLPTSATPQFPALLEMLELNGDALGVRGFGITVTTLEEVFLKIAEEEEADVSASPAHRSDGGRHSPASETAVEIDARHAELWEVQRKQRQVPLAELYMTQFRANIIKRFHNSKRDRRTQMLQIVVPVICVLLSMLFTLLVFVKTDPLEIHPRMYGKFDIDKQDFETANCASLLNAANWDERLVHTVVANISNGGALSQHLIDTFKKHGEARFNAMYCSDATLAALTSRASSMLFYNTTGLHSIIDVTNQYYRNYLRTQTSNTSADVRLTMHPWALTEREDALFSSIRTILIGIIIMIPFTFIPSTFVSWIVKERECKAKHLQTSSGLNFFVYWTSNMVFDFLSFLVTIALVFIVFLIFSRNEYIGNGENFGATLFLFIAYGLAGIAGAYLVSFLFEEHSQAQNIVMLANFIAGFLLVLVIFILDDLGGSTQDAAKVLKFICRFIPSYCLGEGIINMALADLFAAFNVQRDRFDMDVTGWPILYMMLEFPIFLIATMLIDHPTRRMRQQQLLHNADAKPAPIENEDPDVAEERAVIERSDPSRADDLVVVRHLSKQYPGGKLAVRNLSFGVKKGEVFGFLGTNGAGKTTTISILCGEHMPTTGHCFVAGHDVVSDALSAQRNIGYCPQFDALLDLLTVHEHLVLYSRIRGLDARATQVVVDGLMDVCDLKLYRDVVSSALSGGNKRKLSVAISLIGGPKVVFLDEPSAGMDVVARRGMWEVIHHISEHSSVVLTTHHLEEVESLAHRVAIMVDGRLHCIGDKTHLKNKFGSGFEMVVRLDRSSRTAAFEAFMAAQMGHAKLEEKRGTKYTYALPPDTRLSAAFGVVERVRGELGITDYCISQTSLEQVFLRISEAEADGEMLAANAGSPQTPQPTTPQAASLAP